MLTIAVASDLHAAEEGSPDSFLYRGAKKVPWKQHPIESLRHLIHDEGLAADFLVCPGDFTNCCSLPGFQEGWEAVNEIAGYLNAELIGTIGNHDVDSRGIHGDPDVFSHAKAVSPRFPVGEENASSEYWARGFTVVDRDNVAFLVINSATEHGDPELAKHGSVSDGLREAIDDALASHALAPLRVTVVHHHPHLHENFGHGAADVMYGGSELTTMLARHGFQLIIHGHRHHPKLSYAAGDSSSPTVFASGSLTRINYAPLASNTRNLFHLINLEPSNREDCTILGSIRSWEYNAGDRWNPATSRSAGFPHYAGFGCRATVARLTNSIVAGVVDRVSWGELVTSIPCLAYTLPTTRETILASLHTQSIQVFRDELGEPRELAQMG